MRKDEKALCHGSLVMSLTLFMQLDRESTYVSHSAVFATRILTSVKNAAINQDEDNHKMSWAAYGLQSFSSLTTAVEKEQGKPS